MSYFWAGSSLKVKAPTQSLGSCYIQIPLCELEKCAPSSGLTHSCANVHGLISTAWLDFSPYLPFPLKLFCAGHNLQKQMYSVMSVSFTVFEGLDAQGKGGHRQRERDK